MFNVAQNCDIIWILQQESNENDLLDQKSTIKIGIQPILLRNMVNFKLNNLRGYKSLDENTHMKELTKCVVDFRFPALTLSPNLSSCLSRSELGSHFDHHSSRVSAYDNVVNNNNNKPVSICLNGSGNSDNDDALVRYHSIMV